METLREIDLVNGRIPADVFFRGSCNNPGPVMTASTRLVAEETERKRCVRDVWNRTSATLGA